MTLPNFGWSRKLKNGFTWVGKKNCHFLNYGSREKMKTDLQSRNIDLQSHIQFNCTFLQKKMEVVLVQLSYLQK